MLTNKRINESKVTTSVDQMKKKRKNSKFNYIFIIEL